MVKFLFLQGRKDPVAKLEKQLAEKEKALAEQNDAMAALSNKLKELRTELNLEKHQARQHGENAQSYQKNIDALTSRLQLASEEKNQMASQIQQVPIFTRYLDFCSTSPVDYHPFDSVLFGCIL